MLFDDYKYKDIATKIKIKLQGKQELSTWEISNFINNFSTYYYRFEIIETIAIAINNGVSPKNIFIFNKSFSLNKNYSKFDIIDLDTNKIPYILSLGGMISIFPNFKLISINFIIEACDKLNDIFKNSNVHFKIDNNYLTQYYNNIKELNVIEEFEKLEYLCKHVLSNIQDKEIIDKIKQNIHKFRIEYSMFMNSKSKINSVLSYSSLDYNQMSLLDDINIENFRKEENELFEKYFHKFFSTLSRLPRPVVAIYYEDENVIKILCKAHINKNKTNVTTLDLKSFSHNSPPFMDYLAGQFISKGIDYITSGDERKLKKELLTEQIKTEKLKQNTEIEKQKSEKLAQIQRELVIVEKINNINKSNIPYNVKDINNNYLRNELTDLENKAGVSLQQLLARNKFDLVDESIERAHINTYK